MDPSILFDGVRDSRTKPEEPRTHRQQKSKASSLPCSSPRPTEGAGPGSEPEQQLLQLQKKMKEQKRRRTTDDMGTRRDQDTIEPKRQRRMSPLPPVPINKTAKQIESPTDRGSCNKATWDREETASEGSNDHDGSNGSDRSVIRPKIRVCFPLP